MGLTGISLAFYKVRTRFFAAADLRANKSSRSPEDIHRGRTIGVGGKLFNVTTPAGAAAYLWSMFSLTKPTAEQVWSSIIDTYGEDHVIEVLKPHPIHVPPTEDWQMEAAVEYCYFWLLRYAKDVAITLSATRTLIASSALIPIFFVPPTLENVLGNGTN